MFRFGNLASITTAITNVIAVVSEADMTKSAFSKITPLLLVSIIWLTIGWYLRDFVAKQRNQFVTAPAQQRILKAQNLLMTRQLRDDTRDVAISPAQAASEAAIDGMLKWSRDPYADLYGSLAAERFAADAAGATGVPGYWYDLIDGKFVVIDVEAGTGAEQAGLQKGDILLSADGVLFDETISGNEASIIQRGPLGATLQLTVQRGEQIYHFAIKRSERYLLSSKIIQEHVGYLDLDYFTVGIEKQVRAALQQFQAQAIEGLIWDLRGNYGGSLQTTQTILSYFITEGVLFTIEFNDHSTQTFSAGGDTLLPTLPIVVLIDEHTNSSAEIAAAAMDDHKRSPLIGRTTKGKGMVQDTIALDEDYLLTFTIAKWLTPSNRWIQDQGVKPEIFVVDDPATPEDEVLNFALEQLAARRSQ